MLNDPMYSPEFFKQVQDHCRQVEWARQALQKLEEEAAKRWESPFDIPLLGGGWSHNYNCPNEGDRLERVDRHHHRCPTCGSIWSGSPWDEVAVSHEHNYYSTGSKLMALHYGITGEERAAEWAKQVLLFYAEHYEQYEMHDRHGGASKVGAKVMCQTLSESSWVLPLAQAYCILKLHGVLSSEERQLIENKLFLQIIPLLDGNPMRESNWQSYHNAARAWIAAAAGRRDLLEQAVYDPNNGFLFQMENSLSDDGFWYEGAWGYHFYTLEAQLQLVLAAQFMGLPLHENARFQSMFRAPLQCMFPDGTLPPVHDSGIVNVHQYAPLYEYANRYFKLGHEVVTASKRDSVNALLFGVDTADNSRRSDQAHATFTELAKAGMIYMRQPSSQQVAMVDYGEHGGYHGHRDKLSLLYYGGGHPWLSDAGMLPYGNAVHEAFFKQTIAHNTVTIGGRSQQEAKGHAVRAERTEGGWLYLETETEEAYPGALLRRRCVLNDRLLLDVVEVRCETEQDVDWIIHTQGLPIQQQAHEKTTGSLGSKDGYEFLKNAIQWSPEASTTWLRSWRWDDGEHRNDRLEVYGLTAPDQEGEELYLAEAPAMPSIGKLSTMLRRRRSVKQARFITVFRACREEEGRLAVKLLDGKIGVTFPEGTVQEITV